MQLKNLGLNLSAAIFVQYFLACLKIGLSFKKFDDTDVFKLNWPGQSPKVDEILDQYKKKILGPDDAILVSSVDNEVYMCTLPKNEEASRSHQIEYFGPSPSTLIQQLYDQRVCTYRIEVYWTYELCHGQYLLQYHEEKENMRTKRQDYYLGQYITPESDAPNEDVDYLNQPPKRKIDDQILPYFTVKYTQGTLCDINGRPRQTLIHYVCDPNGKNQIYSFDEVSSCEYELVILTSKLCQHPSFKPEKTKEHPVDCYPIQEAPRKPTALILWEKELRWEERATKKNLVLPSVPKGTDSSSLKREGARFKPKPTPSWTNQDEAPTATLVKTTAAPPTDQSLANSFLSGDYCLYGGQGWWKYEYCHGKHVTQYHEDLETGITTRVLLGAWNIGEHKKWLQEKPHKKPTKRDGKIMQISHFYSQGDPCHELNDEKRRVEVRLKCKETLYASNAVSLYLLEPKTCEYILGVESNMFCNVLQTVDEYSLFKNE